MTLPMLPPVPPRMGIAPPMAPAPLPPPPLNPVPGAAPPMLAAPLAGPGGVSSPPPSGMPPPGAVLPEPAAASPPVPLMPPPLAVTPETEPVKRQPPEKIKNPFERQAAMIVAAANDQAKRLAQNLGIQPADSEPVDPATVHEMFHFSPYGTDAPAMFWQKHAELLQLAQQNNDEDPYAVAERGALDDVYPKRAELALLDHLGPEQKVKRAEELLRASHRETAAGNPPTALPSIVGPAALPPGKEA